MKPQTAAPERETSTKDSKLCSRILRVFRENTTHRAASETDKVLLAALEAWSRKPPKEDVLLFQSMGVLESTYDSLTRVKLVQIIAVLNRVFGQPDDKSWGLEASPDPTLPIDVQSSIVAKYATEGLKLAQAMQAQQPEDIANIVMQSLKQNESQIEADKRAYAQERAERMERAVDDILMEARFTGRTMRQFIVNLTKYGTALIVGPCETPTVVMKLVGKGDNLSYKPTIEKMLQFYAPNPMDVYPSPGATEADDADLCILERYSKAQLARAADIKSGSSSGWRPSAIQKVLKDQQNGFDEDYQSLVDATERRMRMGELVGTSKKYSAIRWFGLIPGEELRELGIESDSVGAISDSSYYETEAIVLGREVVYARVCDPAIGRPVVKTTFYGDSTQFFGYPPSNQINNCQKLMDLSLSALKKQLQLSGLVPLVVNDYSSFVDADRPGAFALTPGKVFLRNANSFTQPGQQVAPIQPLALPNIIREVIALFEAIAKLADDASGFNRNMLGSGNFAGAARTATGLMQIQEASSIIATFVIGNIDSTCIVPLLNKIVASINADSTKNSIKGDPQIIARGQLSKVMKSSQQQVIAAGFSAMQSGVLPQLLGPEKLLIALREYLKSMEFPHADKIIPDAQRMEFLEAMADAERSIQMMGAATQQQQVPQGGQEASQQGGNVSQGAEQSERPYTRQTQPQQAQAEAGLGMPSQVEGRKGAA